MAAAHGAADRTGQRAAERIYGFDLVRLASFVAIAFFHISLIHYYELDVPLSRDSVLAQGIEVYARSLSFSGFTVAFLTSILTGYSGSSLVKRMRLFGFLSAGWVVFSLLMAPVYEGFLAWDIYPLIFVGVLVATACEYAGRRSLWLLGAVGYAMLWVPFWKAAPLVDLSVLWRNVLGFADCATEVAEWPVLPWIGLVWFGYALGVELKHARAGGRVLELRWREAIVWTALLAAGATQWGAFYHIELGTRFSCEVYRMPPAVYWGHFVWPVFAIRVSVDARLQRVLARWRLVRWIGDLAISRKFWAAYILSYLIAHLESVVADASGLEGTRWETDFIVLLAIVYLPLTELATRGVVRLMTIGRQLWNRRSAGP